MPSGTGVRSTRHLRVRVYAGVNLARKDIFGARYANVPSNVRIQNLINTLLANSACLQLCTFCKFLI